MCFYTIIIKLGVASILGQKCRLAVHMGTSFGLFYGQNVNWQIIWAPILGPQCQLANHMGASLRQRRKLTLSGQHLGAFCEHFSTILGPFWHPKELRKAVQKQHRFWHSFRYHFGTDLDHFGSTFRAILETFAVPIKHRSTSRKSSNTFEKLMFFDDFTLSTVSKKRPKTMSRQSDAKIIVRPPKCHQNGSKSGPKMVQNGSQNSSKHGLETTLVFCCFSRPKKTLL